MGTDVAWHPVCRPLSVLRGSVLAVHLRPLHKEGRYFGSASDAITAAREHVRGKLNPAITAQQDNDEDEELRDVLGLQEWRMKKQNARAETQIVRNRKSKSLVVVERKKEGRRRDKEKA